MGAAPIKRTSLFCFGDRFTDPDKEWVVVASEATIRAYVLRNHLNIKNVLTMRSGFPENLDKNNFSNVGEYTRATADGKAKAVAKRIFDAYSPDEKQRVLNELTRPFDEMPDNFDISKIKYVIGADTVCDVKGTVYEKPKDEEEARKQFKSYQTDHPVITTGISAYARDRGYDYPIFSFYDCVKAYFQTLTDEDIDAYIKLEEWKGVAGSYKITGFGESLIERIEGCYTTSVGMPANKVNQHLCQYLNSIVP